MQYSFSPTLILSKLFYLSTLFNLITFKRYLHPSQREQSTIFPMPVSLLYFKAASVAVIPRDAEAKSAK